MARTKPLPESVLQLDPLDTMTAADIGGCFELLLSDKGHAPDPAYPVEVSEIIEWNRRRLLLVRQRPTPNSPGWKWPIDFGIDPGPPSVSSFTPAGDLIVCDGDGVNLPQEVAV